MIFTISFIIAQVLGLIALTLIGIGYFQKAKGKMLILNAIANSFYATAFLFTGAYVAMTTSFISIGRCIYIYYAEKYSFKFSLHFLSIFIIAYIITALCLWSSPLDLMPLTSSILFTIGYSLKDLQTMRYFLLIPNTILCIYCIIATNYTNALLDAIEIIILVVAIIKFAKLNKKNLNINIDKNSHK